MRLVLFDNTGDPAVEVDQVERYDLLALAASLRLAVTAAAEGWPPPPPPDPAETGQVVAVALPEPPQPVQ